MDEESRECGWFSSGVLTSSLSISVRSIQTFSHWPSLLRSRMMIEFLELADLKSCDRSDETLLEVASAKIVT